MLKHLFKPVFVISILFVSIACILFYWGLEAFLRTPLTPNENTVVELSSGQSFRSFAEQLAKKHIIESSLLFELLYRLEGSPRVQAGEYSLGSGMKPEDLLKKLIKGEVVQYPFTIIEGSTLKEIKERISQLPKLKYQTIDFSDKQLCQTLRGSSSSLEGLLFPETYFYVKGDTPEHLVTMACQMMLKTLDTLWNNRDVGLPLKTAYEALIMASLIEKETGHYLERPLIAGVFYNRLAKGMRLQTDPTVIYGLGENYSGKLSHSDLLIDTPYNTYKHNGLPPTPIASPSRQSIEAALHPQATSALFFVANKDGSHVFTDTYESHLQNITQYLKSEEHP